MKKAAKKKKGPTQHRKPTVNQIDLEEILSVYSDYEVDTDKDIQGPTVAE